MIRLRRSTAIGIGTYIVLVGSMTTSARAEEDAQQQQQRAVATIGQAQEQYYRTGDVSTYLQRLRGTQNDLAQSAEKLRASNPQAAAMSLARLGDIQRAQQHWLEADATYGNAINLAREQAPAAAARAWRGRGFIAGQIDGDYPAAIEYLERAVRIATGNDQRVTFFALIDLAVAYEHSNDPGAADVALRRAAEIAERTRNSEFLNVLWEERAELNLQFVFRCSAKSKGSAGACGEALAKADEEYRTSIRFAQEAGFEGLVSTGNAHLKELADQRAMLLNQDKTNAEFRQQLAALGESHPRTAADVAVFDFGFATMNPAPALNEKGKEIIGGSFNQLKRQREQFGFRPTADFAYLEGTAQAAAGDKEAALRSYQNAIELLETERVRYSNDRARTNFVEDKVKYYYAPVGIYLSQQRYAEAFDLLERSRSRGMADLIAARQPEVSSQGDRADLGELLRLESGIAELRKVALNQRLSGSARLPETEQRLSGQERELATVRERINTMGSKIGQLTSSSVVPLARAQELARAGHYDILYYFVTNVGLVIWHIGPASMQVRFLPLASFDTLQVKLERLRRSSVDSGTPYDTKTARELNLYLVEPMRKFLETDHLVVIPHSNLVGLGFQLLQDTSGNFLGERYKISYAPSVTLLSSLKPGSKLAGARVLAVADPKLELATEEVKAIGASFGSNSTLVFDRLMPKTEVGAAVRGYDVVHFAVHGVYRADQPLLSYIALGAGGTNDGRLTAAEMFGLPLDRAHLVVLSGCETGRSEVTANELLGIQRALLFAGAQGLLVSSWKIDTNATVLWMKSFYAAAQSKPPAEAGRDAIRTMRKSPTFAHPYYWAAFNLIGG